MQYETLIQSFSAVPPPVHVVRAHYILIQLGPLLEIFAILEFQMACSGNSLVFKR